MPEPAAPATPTGESILRVEDVSTWFPIGQGAVLKRHVGDVKAVNGVSFDLRRGETLGLVGESGCGKSTLVRTILRLIKPTSGHVYYDGRDVFTMNRHELRELRRDVQIIFQDPHASLNPRMTVFELIADAWRIHRGVVPRTQHRARAGELLERVGLNPAFLDRYPHQFSGGQRQRIGIARALALEPKIIVCDEPVSALDVSVQAQVVNLLEDLQDEFGLSYLFIAHDLSVVRHISDRIAVMYLGKIVEIGTGTEICDTPTHPYTQALLSAVPVPDPEQRDGRKRILLEGDLPSPSSLPSGCSFHTRCWKATNRCREEIPELVDRGGYGRPSRCFYAELPARVIAGERPG